MAKKHSILCADDDPEDRKFLDNLLKDRGYSAKTVSNGSQVLTELKKNSYDLVILNHHMPVMDGVQTAERIRSHPNTFNIPIIFASSEFKEKNILDCLRSGGNDYIRKPFDPDEVMAKIIHCLEKYNETFESEKGLPQGAKLAGRYEIVQRIDSGGFSNIYKAIDVTDSKQPVYALKVFDFPFTKRSNRQKLYTILREAYQLCKLDHPCIVKIHDFGQFGSVIFLVLEYIDGQPLDLLVQERGPLPEINCCFIGYEVASVLNYMNARNMTHRDIKPDNMMVTQEGDFKLVDFGLSKQTHEHTLSLKVDEFCGTARYVSPEYIAGKEVDIRSDLYALGISLYYISTGRTPFEDDDPQKVLCSQVQTEPESPQVHRPDLSTEFSELVLSMLAKDPDNRPSLADVKNGLTNFLSNV